MKKLNAALERQSEQAQEYHYEHGRVWEVPPSPARRRAQAGPSEMQGAGTDPSHPPSAQPARAFFVGTPSRT